MTGAIALVAIGLVSAIGLASGAQASSILVDQGSTTYDPGTGLTWLDLTTSTGYSYNDITGNANGATFLADGWTLASASDVVLLFKDAGSAGFAHQIVGEGSGVANPLFDVVTNLGALFGFTNSANTSEGLAQYGLGLLNSLDDGGKAETAEFADLLTSTESTIAILDSPNGPSNSHDLNERLNTMGAFLYRRVPVDVTVTPLPAALPMFAAATGLMGLMGWRRRNRNAA